MTDKRLDFSVLPDGFLIEAPLSSMSHEPNWHPAFMSDLWRQDIPSRRAYRLALNYWHFNDGSMVLPDGLSVEVMYASGVSRRLYSESVELIHTRNLREWWTYDTVVAVKILGVHPDYADHGKELGLEVVEL